MKKGGKINCCGQNGMGIKEAKLLHIKTVLSKTKFKPGQCSVPNVHSFAVCAA